MRLLILLPHPLGYRMGPRDYELVVFHWKVCTHRNSDTLVPIPTLWLRVAPACLGASLHGSPTCRVNDRT